MSLIRLLIITFSLTGVLVSGANAKPLRCCESRFVGHVDQSLVIAGVDHVESFSFDISQTAPAHDVYIESIFSNSSKELLIPTGLSPPSLCS